MRVSHGLFSCFSCVTESLKGVAGGGGSKKLVKLAWHNCGQPLRYEIKMVWYCFQSCERLQDMPQCKEALFKYARTNDAVLQKVVCKAIYCMLEAQELRWGSVPYTANFGYLHKKHVFTESSAAEIVIIIFNFHKNLLSSSYNLPYIHCADIEYAYKFP